jgi:hypothetical protein
MRTINENGGQKERTGQQTTIHSVAFTDGGGFSTRSPARYPTMVEKEGESVYVASREDCVGWRWIAFLGACVIRARVQQR